MSLKELPTDILCHLFSYLDKNSAPFVETCKKMSKLPHENGGYLSKIKLEGNTKESVFVKTYFNHCRTIERVYIEGRENPHQILVNFPKIINCYNCKLTEPFIPNNGNPCETEVLIFRQDFDVRTPFKTNWSLFPKLKVLILIVEETDLQSIQENEKIEEISVYINTKTYKR